MEGEGNKTSSVGMPTNSPATNNPPQTSPVNTVGVPQVAGQTAGNPATQYNSSDIGIKTSVKTDPFAKQKQDQAKAKKDQRKIMLIVGLVGILVIVGLVVAIVLIASRGSTPPNNDPEIAEEEETDDETSNFPAPIAEVSDKATEATGENGTELSSGVQIFDQAIEEAKRGEGAIKEAENETEYLNTLQLAKLSFLVDYAANDEIVANKDAINPETLTAGQRATYYNILYMTYYDLNDLETANHYSELAGQAIFEVQGENRSLAL